jgi:2-succinyl-6-hydroxy-2,4-cyclohexadiene-1-carboxylate synthase
MSAIPAARDPRDAGLGTRTLRRQAYGVRMAGDAGAPVVLLLHGFAGSSADWDLVADALAASGFRAVAVDLPGHGGTAAPAGTPVSRFSAAETALDLLDLLDQLEVTRAHWVGYSMGGRLALAAALDHPERVETLTLESTAPGFADDRERADRVRSDEALAASIESRGVDWFAESWESLPIFASQRALSDAIRAELAARRRRNDAAGLSLSLRAIGQGALPYAGDRLSGFPRPVLLVTGDLDTKYVELAAAMAARIPIPLHLVVPGAGHNVHLEQPAWFVRSLLTHLRRNAGLVPHASPATP